MYTQYNCVHEYQHCNALQIADTDGFSKHLFNISSIHNIFFYRCTVHFEIYVVHTPTNAVFINWLKDLNLH